MSPSPHPIFFLSFFLSFFYQVPWETEIGLVKPSQGGQYPGLYIWTTPAKMMRPVKHLGSDTVELIGCFEQVYLDIAVQPSELVPGVTTHVETAPTNMLSVVANVTPFCDFNQSPRNMYQCLSVDHDVLTEHGWQPISKVQAGTRVMTMNTSTGVQEWHPAQATSKVEHKGPLYLLQSAGMDAVCDSNHRWLVNTKSKPKKWGFYRTSQMLGTKPLKPYLSPSGENRGHWDRKGDITSHRNHGIPCAALNTSSLYLFPDISFLPSDFTQNEQLNADWLRFVGFVLGDGGISHTTGTQTVRESHYVQLHQSENKPAGVQSVKTLLARLSIALPGVFACGPPTLSGTKYTWTIPSRDLYNFFLPMITGPRSFDPTNEEHCISYDQSLYRARIGTPEDVEVVDHSLFDSTTGKVWDLRRWLYYGWFFQLSKSQARAFLEGMTAANGELSTLLITRGGLGIFSSSIPLVHDLFVLGTLAEARVSLEINHKKGDDMPSIGTYSGAIGCRVSFAFGESEMTVALPQPREYINSVHDGFVYCLQVQNGNFLSRRRTQWSLSHQREVVNVAMKPFFTGNVSFFLFHFLFILGA